MVFRSLQATAGGATYIISLPKEWVEYQKLKKGRQLAIEERADGALVIRPQAEPLTKGMRQEIFRKGESAEELFRSVIGKYVGGAGTVVIKGEISWKEEKALSEWVSNLLLGATLSRDDKNLLILTVAIDEELMPPQKILRRAHNIAYWMYMEAVSQISKGDASLTGDIIGRDKEVDKLYVICRRSLNKAIIDTDFRVKAGLNRGEMSDYFRAMDYVELIADLSCAVARSATAIAEHKLDKKDAAAFETVANDVGAMQRDSLVAFFSRDVGLSNKVIKEASKTTKEIIPRALSRLVPRQNNKGAAVALSDALNSIMAITEITKHVCELNIDRCVREG